MAAAAVAVEVVPVVVVEVVVEMSTHIYPHTGVEEEMTDEAGEITGGTGIGTTGEEVEKEEIGGSEALIWSEALVVVLVVLVVNEEVPAAIVTAKVVSQFRTTFIEDKDCRVGFPWSSNLLGKTV